MALPNIVINITTKGAVASLKGLEKAAVGATRALAKVGTAIGTGGASLAANRGLTAMVGNLNNIFGLLVKIETARFLQALPGQVYDLNRQFTAFQNTLLTTFGSTQQVAAEMEFLRGVSQRLGTDIVALTGGYTKFAAAAEATTLSINESRQIFEAFSGAATVLQLDAQSTELTFRALTQMLSKGKVQAEELRGQLAEHLPGAFQVAAKAMNVTTGELDQMLRKGEVLATDLLPKMAAALKDTYALGLIEATKTWASEVGRLNNAFKELGAGLGAAIQEPARDFTRWIKEIVEKYGPDIIKVFKDIGEAGYLAADNLSRSWKVFSDTAIKIWEGVSDAISNAMGTEVVQEIDKARKSINEFFGFRTVNSIQDFVFNLGRLQNAILAAFSTLPTQFETIANQIVLMLKRVWLEFRLWFIENINDFGNWLAEIPSMLVKAASTTPGGKWSTKTPGPLIAITDRPEDFTGPQGRGGFRGGGASADYDVSAIAEVKQALASLNEQINENTTSWKKEYFAVKNALDADQEAAEKKRELSRATSSFTTAQEYMTLALERGATTSDVMASYTNMLSEGFKRLNNDEITLTQYRTQYVNPVIEATTKLIEEHQKKQDEANKSTEVNTKLAKEQAKEYKRLSKEITKLGESIQDDIRDAGEEMAVLAIKTRDVGKESAVTERDIAKLQEAFRYGNQVLELNNKLWEINGKVKKGALDPKDAETLKEEIRQLLKEAEVLHASNEELINRKFGLDSATEANDKLKDSVEETAKVFEDIATNIHSALSDAFFDVFNGAENAFGNFAKRMKEMFLRLLADLAAMALSRTIVIPIIGMVAGTGVANAVSQQLGGGAVGQVGGAAAQQGVGGLLGQAGTSILGAGMGLVGSGLMGLGGAIGGGFGLGLSTTGAAWSVGAYGAGLTQAASFLATGASGILPAIGSVMPYVAIAALVGYGLYKAFGGSKKDVTPDLSIGAAVGSQIGDLYAGEGDVFGQVESAFGRFGVVTQHDAFADSEAANQFMQMLNDLAEFENRLASFLGDDVIESIRAALEEGAQRFKAEDPEDFDALIQEFLKDRFDTIFGVIGGTVEQFYQLLSSTAPDTLSAVEAMYNLYTAIGGLAQIEQDAATAIELLSKTQWEAGVDFYNSMMDQIDAYDGSYEATVALTGGLEQFRQAALQMLVYIDQVQKAVAQAIAQTRENIMLSGMTAEEQFDYYRKQADALARELAVTTDPTRIAEIVQEINRLTELSWGLLTPEQQDAQRQDYLNYLDGIEKLANERLEIARQETVNAANAMAEAVLTAIETAAQAFIPPAQIMDQAAWNFLSASTQPTRVDINVVDGAADIRW